MSSAAPVVSVSVTYIGPALTAGSGLATNPANETTISTATMKITPTSSSWLVERIDRAPVAGRDLPRGPRPPDCPWLTRHRSCSLYCDHEPGGR